MVSKQTKRLIVGISILILFILIGLVYILVPHETRVQLNINLGLGKSWNIAIGIIIIVIGIILFLLTLLTNMLKKINRLGRKYWFLFLFFDIFKWIVIVGLGIFLLSRGINIAQSVLG